MYYVLIECRLSWCNKYRLFVTYGGYLYFYQCWIRYQIHMVSFKWVFRLTHGLAVYRCLNLLKFLITQDYKCAVHLILATPCTIPNDNEVNCHGDHYIVFITAYMDLRLSYTSAMNVKCIYRSCENVVE